MEQANTRGATNNYLAPANWNAELDGECAVLEVRVEATPSKLPVCISTWKPSREELIRLLKGDVIELHIVGDQPPVMLTVVEPVHPEPKPERASVVINEHGHGFDEHGPAYPL